MNEKNIFIDYFKKGISVNLIQVFISFLVGLLTTLVFYNKLSSLGFIIYTSSQLTVFFFVNFSTLELGNLIKKVVPQSNNIDNSILITNILKLSITSFLLLFLIYSFGTYYFNLFNFEELNLGYLVFFIYIFAASLIQIFVNLIYEFLAAEKKFISIEKLYMKFLSPFRFLLTVVFYIFYSQIEVALLFNVLMRILQLVIVFKLFGNRSTIKTLLSNKHGKYQRLEIKDNLKFSIKNIIFNNFPLLFFAISPNYLENYFNPDDVAVYSLSLALLNAIKPILFGLVRIVNPSLVNLVINNSENILKKRINFVFSHVRLFHYSLVVIFWLLLNQKELTMIFLEYFSYSLFLDFIVSIILIMYLYSINMILQSIYVAKNIEKKFFYVSLFSSAISLIFLMYFALGNVAINFVLFSMIIFYFLHYVLLLISLKLFSFREIMIDFVYFLILFNAFRTFIYSGIYIFGIISILLLVIFISIFKKINKKYIN